MNGGDRTYLDEFKKEVRSDIRSGSQAINQLTNEVSGLKATVDSLPLRYDERMIGCTNRFEALEKNQGRIVKYGSAAYLIILSIITGTRFI